MADIVTDKIKSFIGVYDITRIFKNTRFDKEKTSDPKNNTSGNISRPGKKRNQVFKERAEPIHVHSFFVTSCEAIKQLYYSGY